ncbi:hypothetical protein PC41400_14665 [Paenibacillus chitinolyticus]|uniref:Uncharacterized protein n=1 Tax=Paenibacillus chitinolyticus TaxID=79263 RepID=A0A410WX43_9BACL|nr:hypothetical protein [Paenibacillus chitinolyticus]MCY9593986.1 hypothetical protein [Paenibacillus chitinolyticus]MCY9599641.1 hypothetical protein [Paenibacillus chitinolyticus]QAV18852.1 hypothetical protein PC41400_14665 [Paenibacillus chitinolyticus]
MIWHVGYDGAAMPVEALTKQEAENKAKTYLDVKGTKCNLIYAQEASSGYLEWINDFGINVIR